MSEKKVVVYGASGYTGRLICEYLREYNVPFVAAGRSQEKLESSLAHNVAGVETADYEIRTVEHDVESLTELFDGASVVLQHGRPVQHPRPGRGRGRAQGRRPLHRHDRRAGLADGVRRPVGREVRRGRAAARARHRADVHHRRDRRPALPGEAGPRHPRHRGLLGRLARRSRRPRRSWSTRRTRPPTSSSRTPTSRSTPGRG